MPAAVLVPCLAQLRAELNRIAPNRDTKSDGTIGDRAHQLVTSDHNDDEVGRVPVKDADSKHEIHALDADADLRESDLTMLKVVLHIVGRCRTGVENRLRYVIFNRTIWEASNAWRARTYTGTNPHTEHAHFSASYNTAQEADTRSWRLEDIPVALTDADKKWLAAQIAASEARTAALIEQRMGDVVTRWDSEGNPLPPSDPNPKMTAASALGYLGRDSGQIKADIAKIIENLPTTA